MRDFFFEGSRAKVLSSHALLVVTESAIGLCYALAAILGIIGAQRYAAPQLPIPGTIVSGLFIGIAIWATLAGVSIRALYRHRIPPIRSRLVFSWLLISFITCTMIPILYIFQINADGIIFQLQPFLQTCLLSALSFGLAGAIIGITAILLHFFFWRLLTGLKWGIILTCTIGFLLGLSAGWAAYGWTVFSSHALLNLFSIL